MTKGRTALSLNFVVPPTIPMDVVHFSLYLPQASRGAPNEQNDFSISIRYWEGETADSSASLGMTKGRVALSLNLVVLATIPWMSFISPSTCRRQVEVLGMTKVRATLPWRAAAGQKVFFTRRWAAGL